MGRSLLLRVPDASVWTGAGSSRPLCYRHLLVLCAHARDACATSLRFALGLAEERRFTVFNGYHYLDYDTADPDAKPSGGMVGAWTTVCSPWCVGGVPCVVLSLHASCLVMVYSSE